MNCLVSKSGKECIIPFFREENTVWKNFLLLVPQICKYRDLNMTFLISVFIGNTIIVKLIFLFEHFSCGFQIVYVLFCLNRSYLVNMFFIIVTVYKIMFIALG